MILKKNGGDCDKSLTENLTVEQTETVKMESQQTEIKENQQK